MSLIQVNYIRKILSSSESHRLIHILLDTYSDIISGILSDIPSGNQSGIKFGILLDVSIYIYICIYIYMYIHYCCILSGILSDVCSDSLSGILNCRASHTGDAISVMYSSSCALCVRAGAEHSVMFFSNRSLQPSYHTSFCRIFVLVLLAVVVVATRFIFAFLRRPKPRCLRCVLPLVAITLFSVFLCPCRA